MINQKLSSTFKFPEEKKETLINKENNYFIFINRKNDKNDRLYLPYKNFLNKKLDEIKSDINKLSKFFEIDENTIRLIFFRTSGEISKIISIIAGDNSRTINFSLWSSLEDEIILSDEFDILEDLISLKGTEEVMKRRLFLKNFKESDFI
jgi:hypothetical protein